MYAGAGRAGDFAGDPLAGVSLQRVAWLDESSRVQIRAVWKPVAAIPGDATWITYNAGAVVSRNAVHLQDFTVAAAGIVPALAALPVPAGVDDGTYNPVAGRSVANLTTLATRFKIFLRGNYRIEDVSLARYELYRGVDAAPDLAGAPWVAFAALPYTSAALAAGHTYYFVLRKRNSYNLCSQNLQIWVCVVDGGGARAMYPGAPSEIVAAQAAAGAVRVIADYRYAADEVSVRADTWALWLTSDGSAPNPASAPDFTQAMYQGDGVARLDWTSGAFAHGSTLKVLVRARRSTGNDSQNSGVLTLTADANGPSALAAQQFFGQSARQG